MSPGQSTSALKQPIPARPSPPNRSSPARPPPRPLSPPQPPPLPLVPQAHRRSRHGRPELRGGTSEQRVLERSGAGVFDLLEMGRQGFGSDSARVCELRCCPNSVPFALRANGQRPVVARPLDGIHLAFSPVSVPATAVRVAAFCCPWSNQSCSACARASPGVAQAAAWLPLATQSTTRIPARSTPFLLPARPLTLALVSLQLCNVTF